MHRIYKAVVTADYKIRTTFYNGEVREYDIEDMLSDSEEYEKLKKYLRLKKYMQLNEMMKIDDTRTRIDFMAGVSLDNEMLYYGGLLIELEDIEDVNVQLAARLQMARLSRYMSQKELEKLTGIHQAEISKIERGIGNPSVRTLRRLAEGLDCRLKVVYESRDEEESFPAYSAAEAYLKLDKVQGEYTVEDMEALPEDIHAELINGYIYDMSFPTVVHQIIVGHVFAEFHQFIKKNKGKCTAVENVGVKFPKDKRNYFGPDLSVICDKGKIFSDKVLGAPDFVLEVASKSNYSNDYKKKRKVYQERGVREYWIIDPIKMRLLVYHFEKNDIPQLHSLNEVVDVNIFEGRLKIDLNEIREIIESYKR